MEPSELIGVHKLLLSSLRTTLMEPRADQLTLCGIRGTHWRLQPDELLTDRPRRSFIASTVGRAAVARQGRKVAEQIHSAARKMISHACLSQATKIARLVPANYSGMLSGWQPNSPVVPRRPVASMEILHWIARGIHVFRFTLPGPTKHNNFMSMNQEKQQ
ncbi:hypothetical protein BRADI_5g15205v3 [Brachypodium distachyon]|uniref:Uncharacterized protein n=1 Tax=Brachypodium distachyon TaxID=15368 RepID=A0A2K2CHC9_BRADI|nr:hypothetical protein BRADI_5g15205v3 [Brachypodium distachyon]